MCVTAESLKVYISFSVIHSKLLCASVCVLQSGLKPNLLVLSRGPGLELKVNMKGWGYKHSLGLIHSLLGWQGSLCHRFFVLLWI